MSDEDFWCELEKDPQGNYALSPEETDVLNSTCSENPFPLFINGRAGSGKSTILQYLYADYYYRSLTFTALLKMPPVYFTCNKELLKNAKNFVRSILKNNTHYTLNSNHQTILENDQSLNENLNSAFMEFREYLLNLVKDFGNSLKFIKGNYVNYTRFRDLWLKKFQNERKALNEYGPDISWHVIRTYIQGINPEDYLEPEDYIHIEEKQKTVSQKAFLKIYENVWKWYSDIKSEKGFWDDQDLVRYVLENSLVKPQFSAVFCDESQDFTRIELEVILRSSLFSNRKIDRQFISKVPFAFAGDELQTLNPTGFRWDALKAWFTEKFIFSLSAGGYSNHQLNFRELTHNYRSSPEIVRFSNYIQLFRSSRFDISGIKPQKPWVSTNTAIPVIHFTPDNAVFWEKIKELPDTVFIIPCHEGEESTWVRGDEYLNKRITINADGITSIPILSANMAKGLEFNRVVVYRFGDKDCPDKILELTNIENETPEQRLPLEYHLNKTYVAISRPKKQLIVIDTQRGLDKLWEFTRNIDIKEKLLFGINSGKSKNWSNEDLYHLHDGDKQNLNPNQTIDDLLNTALQLEERGISSSNSYMLKQAALKYRDGGNNEKANECEAKAQFIDKQYGEAGKKYLELGKFKEAIDSFWLAKNNKYYKKIIDLAETHQNLKVEPEYIISAFILNEKKEPSAPVAVLKELIVKIMSGNVSSEDEVNSWDYALNEMLNTLYTTDLFIPNKKDLYVNLTELNKLNISINKNHHAMSAFYADEFDTAIKLWDESGSKKLPDNYFKAKAKVTKYPANLKFYRDLCEWQLIILEFEKTGITEDFSDEAFLAMISAYIELGKIDEAFKYVIHIRKGSDIDIILKEYGNKLHREYRNKLLSCC